MVLLMGGKICIGKIVIGQQRFLWNKKMEDIMQNKVIKAGDTKRYFVVLASVFYSSEKGKYEGMLLLMQNGKGRAGNEASEIRVISKNKSRVYEQLKGIAKNYPPKEDIAIIDTGGY